MSETKRQADLDELHWFTRQQALKVLQDCKKEGLNVDVFECLRTLARQKFLKSTGKSTTLNSYHRLGLAVDFVFKTENGNWTWNRPKEDWDKLAEIVERHGFKSGWRWKRFRDGPHAQIQFEGYRSTTLYKALDEYNNDLDEFHDSYVDKLIKKDPKLKKFLPPPRPKTELDKKTEQVAKQMEKALYENPLGYETEPSKFEGLDSINKGKTKPGDVTKTLLEASREAQPKKGFWAGLIEFFSKLFGG